MSAEPPHRCDAVAGKDPGVGRGAEGSALRKMALLDTTAIPLDLLSSTERKAVLVLKQHALVTVDDKDLVAIHSLTQLAVRGQTDKEDRLAIAAAVAQALKGRLAKFDQENPATFFIGRRYAAHARAAAANAAAWGLIPQSASSFKLGLHVFGSEVARRRHAAQRTQALLTPLDDWEVGRGAGGRGEARSETSLLNDVLYMCMSAGRFFQQSSSVGLYQQAFGMFEFALVCAVALEGHDSGSPKYSLLVAGSFYNMAVIYSDCGNHEAALELLTKVLEIRTRIYGGDSHPSVADTFNGVACCYSGQGKYEEALEMHTKVLEISTRIYGGDSHPNMAGSYANFANIYEIQGKYEEALEMLTKSLEIRARKYGGVSHPSVADSRFGMGNVLVRMEKYAEAQVEFQQALEMRLAIYGQDHLDVAHSYGNLGNVLREMGKPEEALVHLQKGLEIYLKLLGNKHPRLAITYESVALVYQSLGNPVQAKEMASKAYNINLNVLGPDPPQ